MFITLKWNYQRKKRDLKDVSKSGTCTEVVLKVQKAFRQQELMKWLHDFVDSRQGKNNLPWRGANVEEDENGERDDTGLFEYEDSSTISSEKTTVIPTSNDDLEDRVEEFDKEPTGKQVSKTYVKSSKKKRPVIKGTVKENLIDDMELSLIKDLNDSRKKRKIKDENKEELHCKSLAADLKDLPPFERLNVKREIRDVVHKYQMVVMYKQQPSCFPTNRTSQPTPDNFFQYSVPINNYPSVPLASLIPTPRKWGEHETDLQENT